MEIASTLERGEEPLDVLTQIAAARAALAAVSVRLLDREVHDALISRRRTGRTSGTANGPFATTLCSRYGGLVMLLGAIPSPSSGVLELGPVRLRAYGLMIALGVLAAAALAGRRLERMRAGSRDEMTTITVWSVAGGLVGARPYHVATDWSAFSGDLARIPMIWRGGLGIPGAITGGVAVGLIVATYRRMDIPRLMTAAAPAIALGQSIGRWGNWWNQELFGKPTSLPWALEISPDKVPGAYAAGTTFHPTFLYESLWTLALCGLLLWLDRRFELRPGRLFAVYVLGYGIGRFWIEGLRIDPTTVVVGLRFNQWVAAATALGAAAYLAIDRHRSRRRLASVAVIEQTVDVVA